MRGVPSNRPEQQHGGPHSPYSYGRPNPGMRMGGETGPGRVGSSGRGGVMTMILPMYAVGIVLYLVYTLMKVVTILGLLLLILVMTTTMIMCVRFLEVARRKIKTTNHRNVDRHFRSRFRDLDYDCNGDFLMHRAAGARYPNRKCCQSSCFHNVAPYEQPNMTEDPFQNCRFKHMECSCVHAIVKQLKLKNNVKLYVDQDLFIGIFYTCIQDFGRANTTSLVETQALVLWRPRISFFCLVTRLNP